jgi:hypothetical protein
MCVLVGSQNIRHLKIKNLYYTSAVTTIIKKTVFAQLHTIPATFYLIHTVQIFINVKQISLQRMKYNWGGILRKLCIPLFIIKYKKYF